MKTSIMHQPQLAPLHKTKFMVCHSLPGAMFDTALAILHESVPPEANVP